MTIVRGRARSCASCFSSSSALFSSLIYSTCFFCSLSFWFLWSSLYIRFISRACFLCSHRCYGFTAFKKCFSVLSDRHCWFVFKYMCWLPIILEKGARTHIEAIILSEKNQRHVGLFYIETPPQVLKITSDTEKHADIFTETLIYFFLCPTSNSDLQRKPSPQVSNFTDEQRVEKIDVWHDTWEQTTVDINLKSLIHS